ncbi:reticulon-4-interacting protein 1 homolog, mitochondrial-like [Mercenaria mercenaria]|uniref:reticulon-4-interacting protein 1 homolog, mitochondrial-like n=1 Tax=Mercenaria mercenaria TaxID=6596 RepID=UPI00234E425C|nr:reticulon-4-interacting protein 1 homolog, mitochondrial-like [Mercenaria mercenaria]XP_045196702.2 reticulon-4-interacting protein 1 homolog, mitochondrial-like [Mercenaria mercenaria]XP_045196703.2 reticulon-4-interacting protein 1 homolog, mitochondrial-like [Mercenaria mercenaria]
MKLTVVKASSSCLRCSVLRVLMPQTNVTTSKFINLDRHSSTSTSSGVKRKVKPRMKAWQIYQYGGNEELTLSSSAKIPEIKNPKDLLIEIHAASVNPIDVRMRDGYGRTMINQMRKWFGTTSGGTEFPLTLGRDFSGVVKQTGHGVSRFKPGDEVWGALAAERPGTHAQYCVAGEKEICHKPTSLSHTEAASIPYVALTAWAALCFVGEMTEKNTPGKRVLVHGGAGGIGTFAIQLMKSWGAHVITTCSTDAMPLVKHCGADDVIDYTTHNVADALANLDKVDVVLDPLGGETPSFTLDVLRSWTGAKYVSLVMPVLPAMDKLGLIGGLAQSVADLNFMAIKSFSKGGVNFRWAFFMPNANALRKITLMVDAGQIQPVIDKVFKFEDLPEAYEKVGRRKGRGKTVIDMLS